MRNATVLLAAAVLAGPPLLAAPIGAHQTATVTRASNPTGCPAVVAAQSDFTVDFKVEGDRALVVRFIWSDGTNTPVPVTIVGRSPNKSVTYRARQSRLFSSSASGTFFVEIRSTLLSGGTDRQPFTVVCAPAITVAPGALPQQSPVPLPAR